MLLWIKGEKRIPLRPVTVLGKTPNLLKSKPNLISNQKTIQISRTNNSGYPITPGVKIKGSCFFNVSTVCQYNITKKRPILVEV